MPLALYLLDMVREALLPRAKAKDNNPLDIYSLGKSSFAFPCPDIGDLIPS
tara:strand:+ start:2534 stop:2686 length:153 start_codon:yes stop_codon:yes gene_type:complete